MLFFVRTSLTGVCSFVARLGALLGISLGEYDVLHRYNITMFLAAALSFLSAVLLQFLPEMTEIKMADTYEEIKEVKKDVSE